MQTGVESPRPTQILYTSREERGIQWPCPTADGPTSPVLYEDGFPNGKAEPGAPRFRLIDWATDSEYPGLLAPGRVLLQRERDTSIEHGDLNRIVRDEEVQLHPDDAAAWNVADGDPVVVATATNRITGVAKHNVSVPPGVVAITTLFGELAIELQMSEDVNPMSRVTGLLVEPCRVESLGWR
jgi:predicted molibdopterin-dependent oxidoreductase YjgC